MLYALQPQLNIAWTHLRVTNQTPTQPENITLFSDLNLSPKFEACNFIQGYHGSASQIKHTTGNAPGHT
jgi:hypothetical protein